MEVRLFATGEVGIIRRDTATSIAPRGKLWEYEESDGDWKSYNLVSCKLLQIARNSGRTSTVMHSSDERETYPLEIDFELNQHANRSNNKWHNIRLNTACQLIPEFPVGLCSESAKDLSHLNTEKLDVSPDDVELASQEDVVDGVQMNVKKIVKQDVEMRHIGGRNSIMENASNLDYSLIAQMPSLLRQLELNSGDIKKVQIIPIGAGGYAKAYKLKYNGEIVVAKSCASNLKLDTGAAASQPQVSKKPLRRLVGKEQHQQDKPISISAPSEKALAVPAAAQITSAASIFTDLSPSSFPHHTAVPPSLTTVLHNQRLSQGIVITKASKDCPKAQAMRSVQLIRRPKAPLAKAEAVSAVPVQYLTASGGNKVVLYQREEQWQAQVTERIGHAQRQVVLPVVCAPDCQVAALLSYEVGRVAHLLHVAKQGMDEFVYVGRQGLLGGMIPREDGPKAKGFFHQLSDLAIRQRWEQGDIKSTQSLVIALNTTKDPEEQQALQSWVGIYIEWFNQQDIGNLRKDLIQEYSTLATIQANTKGQADLLERYLFSLTNKIKAGYDGETPLIEALSYSLKNIDICVFKEKAAHLIRLSSELLTRVDFHMTVFSKATYITHGPVLELLHQILVLLPDIDPETRNIMLENGPYSHFMTQLEAIAKESQYFPFTYHSLVLQQSLQRLASGESQIGENLQRAWRFFKGTAYLYQGVHALVALPLEVDTFQAAFESLQAAFEPRCITENEWYDWLQGMNLATLLSLKNEQGYEFFEQGIKTIKDQANTMGKKEERKVLQYGIVIQLVGLALEGTSPKVRSASIVHLSELSGIEAWSDDPVVMELLVESLATIALQEQPDRKKETDQARVCLEALEKSLIKAVPAKKRWWPLHPKAIARMSPGQKVLQEWLGGQTLAGKLRSTTIPKQEALIVEKLFKKIETSLLSFNNTQPKAQPISILLSHIGLAKLKYFVPRAEVQDLRKILETEGVCVVHGHGGSGKSTMTAEYGHEQHDQKLVWWVSAETENKLIESLESMAQELEIPYQALAKKHGNNPSRHRQMLTRELYKALARRSMLLIMDNAKEASVIGDCLSDRPENVQVIITTRDPRSFIAYSQVQLHAFSKEEGRAYLKKRFEMMKRWESEEVQDQLLEALGCIPQRLALASGYLQEHCLISIARYLEKIQAYQSDPKAQKGLVIPQVSLGLEDVSFQGQLLLRYGSYLDPDYMPISLLSSLLEIDPEDMEESVDKLSRLSLVTLDEARTGLQVHREVQAACRQYEGWQEGASMEERAVLEKLVGELCKKMPLVSSAPDEKWCQAQLYAAHASGVVSEARKMLWEHEEVAKLLGLLGAYRSKVQCNFREEMECQKQALAMYQALYPEQNRPDIAQALNSVGASLGKLGKHQEALSHKQDALAMYERLYVDQAHPDLVYSLSDVGSSWSQLGNYQEALKCKKQALEMYEKLYPDQDHAEIAQALNSIGELLSHLGDHQEALEYKKKSLEMRQHLFKGNDHPDVGRSLNSVGISLEQLGDYQQALEYKQKALALRQRLYEDHKDNPDVAHSLNNVGESLIKVGRLEEGIEYCKQALAMRKQLYGEPHHYVAYSLNSIGIGFSALGRFEEGLRHSKEALAMLNAVYPDRDHAYKVLCLNNIANSLHNLGIACDKLGQREKALFYYSQASSMQEWLHPERPNHPKIQSDIGARQEDELSQAIVRGDLKRIQELLSQGVNPNVRNEEGHTALMEAAREGKTGKVLLLIEKGAEVNAMLELEPSEHQGPTAVEQAQSRIESLKEIIEERHDLLLSLGTADSQVIAQLFTDLKQWLQEELLCRPAAGDKGAKEYIFSLMEDPRLTLGEHRVELTKLLQKAYGQALQQVVAADRIDSLPDRVGKLSAALMQLARFHQEQGEQTGKLSHYTDAAILYQHVRTLCEKEAIGYEAQIAGAYEGLAQIKTAMITKVKQAHGQGLASSVFTPWGLQEEIARDTKELEALRQEARDRLARLAIAEMSDEPLYIKGSKALFGHIAKQVGALLGRFYQESEEVLGPAQCKYTVMGLGSMALQQMTPYSDLEFAILMENSKDPAILDKYRAYFRQLSHLVHLRVINLGETVIPRSKYGVSLDYLGKRGISFDLGGKTPLGRKDKPYLVKPYELIQPVSGMMCYLKNEGHKMEHMDKLLPFILERTCYVHGDPGLHEAYVIQKSGFFTGTQTEQGVPIYQVRALQKLLEEVVEMDYSHVGAGPAKPGQQGDLADFAPKFAGGDAGRLYDVKQEIYRLPDRLLCRLAMYYGLLPESGWDAVDQLRSKGIINEVAAGHLGYAVSFATLLRLKTYLHHAQQNEEMAVLSGIRKEAMHQIVSQSFALPAAALEAGGSLFKYYYTALPLYRKMSSFFNTNEKSEGFFASQAFYDDDDRLKGRICIRLMQYEAALVCYKKAIEQHQACYGEQPHLVLAGSLSDLGRAYHKLGNAKQALACQVQALEMDRALYRDQAHSDVAGCLDNVGIAYQALGDARKGLEYFDQALEMRRALYENKAHPELASSLNNMGIAYQALGDARQALAYYEQALEMKQALYGDKGHSNLASSLDNMGIAYQTLGNAKQALTYFEQALEMNKALYGEQAHPEMAASLNNVGNAYQALGDLQKALVYKTQALEMRQLRYGVQAHPGLARSLDNVGSTYEKLGDAKQALRYCEQALEMYKALYGNKAHPELARSLNNVGTAYEKLGDAKQAFRYYTQVLEMYRALYGGKPHPSVAASLNNMGLAYEKLGDLHKGLQYQEEALTMNKALYGGKAHPGLARSLNNVGSTYEKLGDLRKGLAYFERALAMYRALYGDKTHPDLASSLNNVGVACEKLGDLHKGLQYQEQALAMNKTLYGDKAHPELARSLNNVGGTYEKLGDLHKGLAYFEQALAMNKALYGDKAHSELAASLNNVGVAYGKLDVHKGLQHQEQALAMNKVLYGGKAHPDLARSLNNVGSTYEKLGDLHKGLAYFEQALEMNKTLYGDKAHSDLASSLNNLGISYEKLGDVRQGLAYQAQALEMRQALYGDKAHPDVAKSLNNVGCVYHTLSEVQKGLVYFEQALKMYRVLYGAQAHPDLARSLYNVGKAYASLGEYGKAKQHYEQGLMISNKLDAAHPYIQTFTQKLGGLVNQCYAAANKAYAQHDVTEAIRNYEEALEMLPAASTDTKRKICHDLGCMYHVAALSATEEAMRQTYLNKATISFEQAIAVCDTVKAGLWTEYGNFLLATGQLAPAYDYLIQAIASGDTKSKLIYGLMEQATVSPFLQACIDQDDEVQVHAIDYAFFLLIFHYEEFAQVGISLGQPRTAYLASYGEMIRASAGQPGKEKQNELACFFLESLHQALGLG